LQWFYRSADDAWDRNKPFNIPRVHTVKKNGENRIETFQPTKPKRTRKRQPGRHAGGKVNSPDQPERTAPTPIHWPKIKAKRTGDLKPEGRSLLRGVNSPRQILYLWKLKTEIEIQSIGGQKKGGVSTGKKAD